MSIKGDIWDSNGIIIKKFSIAMQKSLISVKNSENSLIPVSVVQKSSKRPFFSISPLWFTAKWLQILRRTTRGHYAMGQNEIWGKNLTCVNSDISVFLRGFLLTSCDFRKSDKLWHLEESGFWKSFQVVLQNFAIVCSGDLRGKKR